MITFNKIGYMGRLGNQMFQYATLLGVSEKTGFTAGIPIQNSKNIIEKGCYDKFLNKWIPYKFDLMDCFNNLSIKDSSGNLVEFEYNEIQHNFDENVFNVKDNTDFVGYYQTQKYFKHIDNKIRNEFQFKDDIVKDCINIKKDYTNIVSIHFRRGDYMGDTDRFPLLDLEYYQEAINSFTDKEYTFFIFSDDIEWCKTIFGDSEKIIYISGNDQFTDMCLMSMCDHNIIANSTFSWWGAWLNSNHNKKVIAPKLWFGPGLSHLNTDDVIPENWIKI